MLKKLALVGLIVAASVAILVAVVGASDDSPSRIYNVRSTPALPVGGVDPRLRASLEVWRRAATSQDAMPAELLDAEMKVHGADAGAARRALVTPDGAAVYLVPADGGVCLASSNRRERGCSSTQDVLAGRTIGALVCSPALPADQVEVMGILPDGAADVRAVLPDGTFRALDVRGNAFVADFPRKSTNLPTAISWTTAAGERASMPSQIPPDAGDDSCRQAQP